MIFRQKLWRAYALISVIVWVSCGWSTEAEEPGPFIPPLGTIVLLTGLPGDLESENIYRQQMEAWLEILDSREGKSKVIILSDAPETIKPPSRLETLSLKNDRATFENLTQTLAAQTNPVVFIVWGHGGRQGSTPVFHVRGPRLTPAEFKAVADKITAPNLRWVLVFRGSGAFAAQLAAKKAVVLASESETMFNNDPIGMSALLKIVKAAPGAPLYRVAEEWGRDIAFWYNDRHLARTEEPTLWALGERPRLLAQVTGPETTNEVSKSQTTSQNAGSEPSTALHETWSKIKRVDPSKYADKDAVILRRRLCYTFGNSPAVSSEQEEFIQVFTLEGKKFGDFDVSFSPPFEEVFFLDCEVLRTNGSLVRFDPELIREERPESLGDYQPARRKFFSLPNVGPGTVLHVRYRTEWQKFPLPHISMSIPLSRELTELATTIEITVPKETPFHFAFEQVSAADPKLRQTSYGTAYIWEFENLPSHTPEILSPPRQAPQLLVSTFPDWSTFADWYSRISKLTDEVTPEIAAKAAELTQNSRTEREKMLAIYNYVTGLRYVAVPLGVNSFRPHSAANVLQNQFGDCKDKASLLNALLHSLKIDAGLVLLPRFSQAYDDVPGLAFNHAISSVRLDGQTIWLDTTDDVCRFGLLPPGDPGRRVLVIDGKTHALTTLPESEARDHQLVLTAKVDCTHASEPLPLVLKISAHGYPDYELRTAARLNKAHASSSPLIGSQLRPVAGTFALERQNATEVSALDEDFRSEAEGTWVGGGLLNGSKGILRPPFWLPRQWDIAMHRRKTPLFLNEGYPLTLDQQFEITLPPKAQIEALPAFHQMQPGPLKWHAEWARLGDEKLSATLHAELEHGELSLAETLAFQKQLREFFTVLAGGVGFSVTP